MTKQEGKTKKPKRSIDEQIADLQRKQNAQALRLQLKLDVQALNNEVVVRNYAEAIKVCTAVAQSINACAAAERGTAK